jgi:hypothetical protein
MRFPTLQSMCIDLVTTQCRRRTSSTSAPLATLSSMVGWRSGEKQPRTPRPRSAALALLLRETSRLPRVAPLGRTQRRYQTRFGQARPSCHLPQYHCRLRTKPRLSPARLLLPPPMHHLRLALSFLRSIRPVLRLQRARSSKLSCCPAPPPRSASQQQPRLTLLRSKTPRLGLRHRLPRVRRCSKLSLSPLPRPSLPRRPCTQLLPQWTLPLLGLRRPHHRLLQALFLVPVLRRRREKMRRRALGLTHASRAATRRTLTRPLPSTARVSGRSTR